MQQINLDDFDLMWYPSPADGTIVVNIATKVEEDENGPKIRVYLNDEVVFENPPYPEN